MNTHKLVDADTGAELRIGDKVKSFRGDLMEILGYSDERMKTNPASTGRVFLRRLYDDWEQEYFPSVINAKLV